MPPDPGPAHDVIRIKGARHNNLKGFDLDLPTRRLIVVTGLSGSGKSSLAFDTLYAEGQRRYIETFSPYARQFFDRMDKPKVDAIEGIPPAVALEQRNSVRTTRSTVGTMTEVCDHWKVLWPHLARLHCRNCDKPVTRETPRDIWDRIRSHGPAAEASPAETATTASPGPVAEVLITFDLPLSERLSLDEQLSLVTRQGFQRLLVGDAVVRVEEAAQRLPKTPTSLTVVQDRVRLAPTQRARFVEACEQAYHFGHGRLAIRFPGAPTIVDSRPGTVPSTDPAPAWPRSERFSRQLHCAACDIAYADPSPAIFSFNHPVGACPECKGFGRIIAIDYDRAIPDRSLSLADGAVRPWQTGMSAECQKDLTRAAKSEGIPLHLPFRELSPAAQRWVIDGDPDHGPDNPWPNAWYGVKGYFRWLESKAYKMHVRVLLSRYRAYRTCPTCKGRRLQPDALLWRLPEGPGVGLTLSDLYALPIREALNVVEGLAAAHPGRSRNDPFSHALAEVQARLNFLVDVGVGYLSLDRPTRTLSGGETQRVNLTTCLGSRLVNTLFVLDEPSVGLHTRDTDRLVRILTHLRDLGNTVVVVEHEPAVMRAADEIIDLGPGHGEAGGHVVAQGPLSHILRHPDSLTGAYLSGRRRIELPQRRPVRLEAADPYQAAELRDQPAPAALASRVPSASTKPRRRDGPAAEEPPTPALRLRGITRNNLAELAVDIPLGRLVCLTGVSGSGKTTLAGELLRLLRDRSGLSGTAASTALGVREDERQGNAPAAAGSENDTTAGTSAGAGSGPGNEGAVAGDSDSTEDADSDFGSGGDARIEGAEHLGALLVVDQAPIGRTPRSNPAVYTGAFDHIRDVFAQTDAARERGLGPSAFSFNSAQGQCEQCRGAGFEKIEMQFLSDVFIRCPACDGRRYRPHLLDIRITPPAVPDTAAAPAPAGAANDRWREGISIADALELTIDDAVDFLGRFPTPAARRATSRLGLVQDVGLGYLRLGQPINTLSGGESQRLKLAGHLADSVAADSPGTTPKTRPTLFLFDEPTTGLHVEDIRILLLAFQRLVEAGHSVLIIEHNLEVIRAADWVIDLGPEAGADGGRVVVAGTPEDVARCAESHTGHALQGALRTA